MISIFISYLFSDIIVNGNTFIVTFVIKFTIFLFFRNYEVIFMEQIINLIANRKIIFHLTLVILHKFFIFIERIHNLALEQYNIDIYIYINFFMKNLFIFIMLESFIHIINFILRI